MERNEERSERPKSYSMERIGMGEVGSEVLGHLSLLASQIYFQFLLHNESHEFEVKVVVLRKTNW